MAFRLVSKFQPTGDQPQAIAQLTDGMKSGLPHQVLLGVTGSGKSVTGDTPVYIRKGRTPQLIKMGELADSYMERGAEKVKCAGNTEILEGESLSNLYAFSIDPMTKRMGWKRVYQITRHCAPKKLHRIRTACGKEVAVTGDHTFWVLRNGKLSLIKTSEMREGDYLPVPRKLPPPNKPLRKLSILPLLRQLNLYFCIPRPQLLAHEKLLYKTLGPSKAWRVLHREERISEKKFLALTKYAPSLRENARVGLVRQRYQYPLDLPLDSHWLNFLGFYLAEGHAADKCVLLTTADRKAWQATQKTLRTIGLNGVKRRLDQYGYQISSQILRVLCADLCGKNAYTKHFPYFWTQLSNQQLGWLIAAYFSGDGGVEQDTTISCSTVSRRLSSELVYALLRFGIHARIRHKKVRVPNSKRMSDVWILSITGQKNIEIFAKEIGFTTSAKQSKLRKLIRPTTNTNVDIIPTTGSWMYQTRQHLGLLQREVAGSLMDRSHISMLEAGIRQPSRHVFIRVIDTFERAAKKRIRNESLLGELKEYKALLNAVWTPVKSIQEFSGKGFVYDFAVQDNETFLAGFGGLFVHNTFTVANIIEKTQRPALIVAANKTLAAQLYEEFKEFFPDSGVHYFVSYFDYYQPEAYIPSTDTYIEKDSKINEVLDRLRHEAAQDALARRDTIVVASVSCIYNIGSPEEYARISLEIRAGQTLERRKFLEHLTSLQYSRNDIAFAPGLFRLRGDTVDVFSVTGREIIRFEFHGPILEALSVAEPSLSPQFRSRESWTLFPAKFWVTPQDKLKIALQNIRTELSHRLVALKTQGKLLEAQRLEQRTQYDLEMIEESGYCHGIENYSRHMEFREPSTPPFTLLDYFPKDFMVFVDESHLTLSQLRAMSTQDRVRKQSLVDHGFRLPSAIDNRPLTFEEFLAKAPQIIHVSATPGSWEMQRAKGHVAEQLIRPTGLLEPALEIRPTAHQMQDAVDEIKKAKELGQRSLVITLTKRLAEEIADHLQRQGVNTQWLHSEIKTLERPEILEKFRRGVYDALVGVNLLREGLDLPEVALVLILDADKEGFLRNETTLIQTMGRAARHPKGRAILYADTMTGSVKSAVQEVERRRDIQAAYNKEHDIIPQPIVKEIREWSLGAKKRDAIAEEFGLVSDPKLLEKEMTEAAKNLDFERAAQLRDLLKQRKDATS
ncbi:MAG: excinuclease ABC subunit UvrB [Candidatus Yanofskybacteria bacterium]|nr:excinuclease ABC subunit UvrB [Candidatus Yanofskybacteria bacterium]